MRLLSIVELMHMTRVELTELLLRITNAMPEFPEGSPERTHALINLTNIRMVLARRDLTL
jgi:hypothetical protein